MVTNEQSMVIPAAEPQGLWGQIRLFGPAFWAANTMELIERWAFYGVRTVLGLYIVDAVAHGGLEFTHIQKGEIYAWWGLVQSLLPMFSGGYADRYGYKNTVAVAIAIKIIGYLLMGTQHSYWGFFAGCLLLGAGTAIFKPGVNGIIANSVNPRKSSVAWGIFYAMVNIGGFLGPWVAGYLRIISWSYVFYVNAALVALNYLTLVMFKEPARPNSDRADARVSPWREVTSILWTSVRDIFEPRVAGFLILFSGFWLMFMQLFDLLPNFIDDWVDSSHVLATLGTLLHQPQWVALARAGGQIQPEWMVNIDAGAIMLFMVPIAAASRRLTTLQAIIWGILVSSLGMILAGGTISGGWCMLGILVFAVGEMLSSPKLFEYMGEIAPPEKRGLFMGYSQVPIAIGWFFGNKLSGYLYENWGDKVNLAKKYMAAKLGMTPQAIAAIPKEKVMNTLAARLHQTPREVTHMLFTLNHPQLVWYQLAAIGIASMIGMVVFNFLVSRPAQQLAVRS